MARILLGIVVAGLAGGVPAARAAPWTWPLDRHQVAVPFHFRAAERFAAGGHRGVLLGASPGSRVRAVCSGIVRFAGSLPRRGLGITIRCGALNATEIGMSSARVRRGVAVVAGAVVGRLGRSGFLQLGAREPADKSGYRDPLGLLGGPHAPPAALAPPPPPAALAPPPPRHRPVLPTAPARRPRVALRPRPPQISSLALAAIWGGLGLLSSALTVGIALRVRRRPPQPARVVLRDREPAG